MEKKLKAFLPLEEKAQKKQPLAYGKCRIFVFHIGVSGGGRGREIPVYMF